jgi:hypothetical protein
MVSDKSLAPDAAQEIRLRNLTLAREAKKNALQPNANSVDGASLPGRMKSIRLRCQDCVEDPIAGVRECPLNDCHLWPYRFGVKPSAASNKGREVGDSPNQAAQGVKDYCEWCSGESKPNRRECADTKCSLWRFRLGAPVKVEDCVGER